MKKNILITLILVLSLTLVACGGSSGEKVENKEELEHIKIGIVGSETEVWTHIAKELKNQGINLEVISFADYNQPNIALAEGDIDLNSFQHYAFFNKFIEDHDLKLTPIGETVIAPLGIYSKKIEEVSVIEDGDKVAIPNDATNGGRALKLLETAGLIKLNTTDSLPVLKDIVENKYNLEILEMDAAIIPSVLEDVKIAVINSGIAVDFGFIPTEDSIFLEPVDDNSKPYINIIVSREEEKDNELYKKVVEAYQTKEVEEILDKLNKGSQVVVW